jgi:hypothetical protein
LQSIFGDGRGVDDVGMYREYTRNVGSETRMAINPTLDGMTIKITRFQKVAMKN